MLAGPSSVRDADGDGAGGDHRRMEGRPPIRGRKVLWRGNRATPTFKRISVHAFRALFTDLANRDDVCRAFTLAVAACGSFVHSALCNSVCRRMSAAVCHVTALALSIAFVFCVVERP